jgi:uncharacterized damage-inducible protein DinB/GNAT superfamily N-acetyltransferase
MPDLVIRPLQPADDLGALTAMLNRAYAALAAAGMNFTAATQDAATTRQRVARGGCLVAVDAAGGPVGSVCIARPYDAATDPWVAEARWLQAPDTAHLNQFGIEPALQRAGLGTRLLAAAEQWAREQGFARMVLDTAEPAAHLRAWYARLGYAEVGSVQWQGKTYRSVMMRKNLVDPAADPMRTHLLAMARYNGWATRRLFEHVDALDDVDYRRDVGLFFRSIHGTLNHLLVGEQLLWWRRYGHGESPMVKLDAEAEPDRQRLRERLIEGTANWLPLIGAAPAERLQGELSYRRTTGEPARLPWTATLMHVFNHGTHHRGQITAALTALGRPAPEIDFVYMLLREQALS